MGKVAALFVAKGGPYFGLDDVDPWDESRDARKYAGPYPVVAHPPCERWGRYATGGPNPNAKRRTPGDDGGCFASALVSVQTFGGVLEHPAGSLAWERFGLNEPPPTGWQAQYFRGVILWCCQVEQGHYGHPARKPTWLLARTYHLPELKWGPSGKRQRLEDGFHSSAERARARCRYCAGPASHDESACPYAPGISRSTRSYRKAREVGMTPCEWLSRKARARTPLPFRDLLIEIARGAQC